MSSITSIGAMYRLCGAKKKQFWTNFKINEHPYPPPQKLPRDRNCIPSNTWFLGLTQVTTLNGISIASCGLSMGKTPQNRPFPWGDLHLYLTYASMGPQDSTTQMVSWSLQPFFHCSPLCPTHTHTHRQTTIRQDICRNRMQTPQNCHN